ncbi:MAG: hypothetical protein M5R42_13115 [Rhodocyclaceae bacterium]|nr:hypothetical protein [Rhodocyclaceae bacterium]
MNFERIRGKAVEQGLLAPDQYPEEAVLTDFIFQAGFSTAKELTEVAGRGVGMDVVKSKPHNSAVASKSVPRRGRVRAFAFICR